MDALCAILINGDLLDILFHIYCRVLYFRLHLLLIHLFMRKTKY